MSTPRPIQTRIFSGVAAGDPARAAIDLAATGELVAAVADLKIRVISLFILSAANNTLTFKSGTTAVTGAMPVAANGGFVWPEALVGSIETGVNEALNLDLAEDEQVSGWLVYQLVAP